MSVIKKPLLLAVTFLLSQMNEKNRTIQSIALAIFYLQRSFLSGNMLENLKIHMLTNVKQQVIQTIRISPKVSLFLLSQSLSILHFFFKLTVFPFVLSELHHCTWPELYFRGLERKYRFWSGSPNKMLHNLI